MVTVTLDSIEPQLLVDRDAMQRILSERMGVTITGYQVMSMNSANDLAVVGLTYQNN